MNSTCATRGSSDEPAVSDDFIAFDTGCDGETENKDSE